MLSKYRTVYIGNEAEIVEEENTILRDRLACIDEIHRQDVRAIKSEYCAQIAFLEEDIKAWRSLHCSNK